MTYVINLCNCPPAVNVNNKTGTGFALAQPQCQSIPDGRRAPNPFFVVEENRTYYTYELINGCNDSLGDIMYLFISIYENIPLADITSVEQRLDGCDEFTPIAFDFENTSGEVPPTGYRFLRVLINGQLGRGACGLYRIGVAGNYQTTNIPPFELGYVIQSPQFEVGLQAGSGLFLGVPSATRLNVVKTCEVAMTEGQGALFYTVTIGNPNDIPVDNIFYSDTVSYSMDLIIGNVTVEPATIVVDTSMVGIIRLNGNIGSLEPGESFEITYQIEINGAMAIGQYTISNLATTQSGFITGMDQCSLTLDGVSLTPVNRCNVRVDGLLFFNMGLANNEGSPEVSALFASTFMIPQGAEVFFVDFDGCTATFIDTGQEVPIEAGLRGPRLIRIECSVTLPPNITLLKSISYATQPNPFSTQILQVTNTLNEVTLLDGDNQILVEVEPLPLESRLNLNGILQCRQEDTASEEGGSCYA